MTANTFGVHLYIVSKTLIEVCDLINKEAWPEYLFLRRNEDTSFEIWIKVWFITDI